jgi:MYXO-CTERM domain-containing protein
MVGAWSGRTGEMMPGSPYLLEDFSFFNSHAIADLNGDDYPEIIAGSAGYFLHAVDGCGRQPKGWPKFTGQWIIPTPAVGDLDGDGALEVAVSTRNGWLYVWRTGGKSDGMIQWESFHHDNRNTGSFEVPLEQGDRSRRAAEPMTEAFCKTALGLDPAPAGLEPTGGCGQCAIGRSTSRNWGLGALLALALAIFRRRRPNRC